VGRGRETSVGRNCKEVSKPAGTTNLDSGGFWLSSSWLDSRLVGKSEVVGDGERDQLGAGMVGEAEQEQLRAAKVRA
jgi:hypothetical protein